MVAGAVAAVGLIPASSAVASEIEGDNFYLLEGGPGEVNHVVMSQSGSNFVITDTAGITDASPDCNQDNPNQVTCARNALNSASAFLNVDLGDMDDEITISLSTAENEQLLVAGGAGNDRLDLSGLPESSDAGERTANLRGDTGNDTMIGSQGSNFIDEYVWSFPVGSLNYDAGDDTMIGGPAFDWIHGGRGSDFLDGRGGPDILEGRITDPIDPNDPSSQRKYVNDNAVDTIFCGGNEPAPPGNAYDVVAAGAGERVGIDCEQIQQDVLCPPGALCDGTPLISTTTTTGATGSAAAAARKRRRVVLGRAPENIRLKGGTEGGVFIELRKKRVRRALGKRRRMTVTFSQNFDRIKNGRKIGEANRRKRFKMRRR